MLANSRDSDETGRGEGCHRSAYSQTCAPPETRSIGPLRKMGAMAPLLFSPSLFAVKPSAGEGAGGTSLPHSPSLRSTMNGTLELIASPGGATLDAEPRSILEPPDDGQL